MSHTFSLFRLVESLGKTFDGVLSTCLTDIIILVYRGFHYSEKMKSLFLFGRIIC
jgi:hypothetical protein